MIATPGNTGPGAGGPQAAEWEVPADEVLDEDVNVLLLAGQRPPVDGTWLWVTTAEGRPGGEFTALFLPQNRPCSGGGDVLLHLAPATDPWEQAAVPAVRVRVRAVVAGSLVLVASWDHLAAGGWPETVRATAVFAMGALKELQEHGADVGVRHQVDLQTAAGKATAGFPGLPVTVRAPAQG
jgi:hypothetical protein